MKLSNLKDDGKNEGVIAQETVPGHAEQQAANRQEDVVGGYAKPSQGEIKKKLTDLQYQVTQLDGTEKPFGNAYWNNHAHGLYVDVVTGEPLFSSRDKYDSGTGWPSFTKPIVSDAVITKADRSLSVQRVEVRSRCGDSHLGHLFTDGPPDRGGRRYCMNSAALKFIPLAEMEKEGYGECIPLVK